METITQLEGVEDESGRDGTESNEAGHDAGLWWWWLRSPCDEVIIWRVGWVLAVAIGSALVLGWAFGTDSLCTTEYSCTTVVCPDSCARINRVAWAEVGILVVCGAIGVGATRWRRLNVAVAVVAVSSLVVSLVLMSRW